MDHVDIEVLLARVLHKDRSWLIAHPEYELTDKQESQFKKFVERRRAGEPVAYIIGEKEFYGRRFNVDQRVLIPRPSTEGLVGMVLQKFENPIIKTLDAGIVGVFIPRVIVSSVAQGDTDFGMTVVDIGTGSGCIAITLACELPNFSLSRGERVGPEGGPLGERGGAISNMRIIATDISTDALNVARENATRHGVSDRIEFREGNLLEPIADLQEPFIIVSNPPYVSSCPSLDTTNPSRVTPSDFAKQNRIEGRAGLVTRDDTSYEPPLALFAGPKGTDVLIPLIKQAKAHPYCQGIFVECQEGQLDSLSLSKGES